MTTLEELIEKKEQLEDDLDDAKDTIRSCELELTSLELEIKELENKTNSEERNKKRYDLYNVCGCLDQQAIYILITKMEEEKTVSLIGWTKERDIANKWCNILNSCPKNKGRKFVFTKITNSISVSSVEEMMNKYDVNIFDL